MLFVSEAAQFMISAHTSSSWKFKVDKNLKESKRKLGLFIIKLSLKGGIPQEKTVDNCKENGTAITSSLFSITKNTVLSRKWQEMRFLQAR